MFSTSLLLLLAAASCVHCEKLSQPVSMVVLPGQSLTINCKVSYSVTSYTTAWIRQPAGKALEWIGYISSGGGTVYSDKLKNKFSISRNTGTNTITLQGQSLQPEDTAVYYCARYFLLYGNYAAFDYWGKGTSVTVSSASQSPPKSLFAVSACAASDGFVTLGCVTSGFTPADSLKITWTGDVSDKVQYPAVAQGGTYTVVSQTRVKETDWNAEKSFSCSAEHSAYSTPLKKTIIKAPERVKVVRVQAPTLLLTASTFNELESGNATFICVAQHFSPKEHEFSWRFETGKVSTQPKTTFLSEEKGDFTKYTAVSILEISHDTWRLNPLVKCEFKHKDETYTKEAKYEVSSDENVDITPPSTEDMLVRGAGELQCKATGPDGFKSIAWKRGEETITSEVQGEVGSASMTAIAKINYDDWSKGTKYTCVVDHQRFAESRTYEYKRENGQSTMCPSVYILAPPENTMDNRVTLTCYVKDFYPKDVIVYWLADDEKLNNTLEYQQRTSCPIEIEKGRSYSVYSQLVVSADDWNSGVVFSCLVYHEGINPAIRMISRMTSSTATKPTLVNVAMTMPSGCVAS